VGRVNTMVFSHLASNVLLIAMALAPGVGLAVSLLRGRSLLSQIDVPTRLPGGGRTGCRSGGGADADEREPDRGAGAEPEPQRLRHGGGRAPFVLGGALKIAHDLMLYGTCRRTAPRDGG